MIPTLIQPLILWIKIFKLHKFISNGEWDYDTYAEIQSEM